MFATTKICTIKKEIIFLDITQYGVHYYMSGRIFENIRSFQCFRSLAIIIKNICKKLPRIYLSLPTMIVMLYICVLYIIRLMIILKTILKFQDICETIIGTVLDNI